MAEKATDYASVVSSQPKEFFVTPIMCPVCGKTKFAMRGTFDRCNVCGWGNDVIQELFPDDDTGFNPVSLNDAKDNFARTGKAYDKFR